MQTGPPSYHLPKKKKKGGHFTDISLIPSRPLCLPFISPFGHLLGAPATEVAHGAAVTAAVAKVVIKTGLVELLVRAAAAVLVGAQAGPFAVRVLDLEVC